MCNLCNDQRKKFLQMIENAYCLGEIMVNYKAAMNAQNMVNATISTALVVTNIKPGCYAINVSV